MKKSVARNEKSCTFAPAKHEGETMNKGRVWRSSLKA